jgi:ribose-phosphate pyrophosphokinase
MANRLAVIAGPASTALGGDVCGLMQISPVRFDYQRFPDGEMQVELGESVRGRDVYVVQSTSPPVEQRLVELLLLADACHRAGAARLTGVIPYFGYARQDRRTDRGALGGRVAANIVASGEFDRVMLVDAHTPAIEGFFDVPLDHLTAVPLLARTVAPAIGANAIVVAPDLGAVKRARTFAKQLHLPMAFVHKTRLNGEAVEAQVVIGEVRGRVPLIVDDILSTGATIEAAVGALRAAGAATPMAVAVTHALLVGRARETLNRLSLARVVATDSVAIDASTCPQIHICSVAPLLATAIERNHRDESLVDLRASG